MIITETHHKKVFSQFGEDGIIESILGVVGTKNKTFIEIGAEDAHECNCRNLKEQGWTGVMLDYQYENEHVIKRFVTAENVKRVLCEVNAPTWPDILSIDIDGNDWYVIKNLGMYLPTKVLVCEYNAHFGQNECKAIPYDPNFKWECTRFYGASQLAMHRLGNQLGYSLVYVNNVNMFFVPTEYCLSFEYADKPEKLYQPTWSHAPDDRMDKCVDPFKQ